MDWGSIIGGALGAYGSYAAAQQANKPRNTTTNQTSTQTPYGQDLIAPGIEGAYNYATQLMQQGPRYIGQGSSTGGGGGTGGGRHGRGGGGQGGGSRGGGQPSNITSLSDQIAQRGLQAGNDPTTHAAQQGVQNILSGQGGADSGGTGYQGYNPILDHLAQHDQQNVDSDNTTDLLRNFLGGTYNSTAGGASAGNAAGGGTTPTSFSGYYQSNGHGGTMANGYGGGIEPDSTATPGLFNDRVKQLLNQKSNDADLQTLIDAQNADITRGMNQANWDLDAQSQGTGRFGGDMWKGLSNDARRNAVTQMATASASTRLQDQAQRQQMYEALLGDVNNRDIAAMNDATQRYGIGASAASSGAGLAAQMASAKRGQDLQALGMLLQNKQYDQGQYGDLGLNLSKDQLGAIGESQGLAGIGLSGLGQANNAVGNLVGQLGAQNSLRAAQIAAGTARAGLNQQAQIYNSELPWTNVGNYFNLLHGIGGMGGTSTTSGTNVVPGAGINPYLAGAMGGYSGYYGNGGGG